MRIKSKLDILTIIIVILFLIVLTATLISSRYIHSNTRELVNISRELDYLTIVKSSLTHLEFNLEGFISNPDRTSKKDVEDALDKFYRVIIRTEDFIMDKDEQRMINHLRENISGFSSLIHRILISKDRKEREAILSDLKERLFNKIGTEIDGHWEEDLQKVKRLQRQSEKGLAFSSYISVGVFFLLLISVFIIRNLVKKKVIDPIQEISRTSYEMAEGRLDREIRVTSRDELEDLAKNFNLMARTLKDKLMTLEDTVNKEQKMVRELAILNDFVGYASSETDFEVILKRFVEISRDLLKTEAAAIYLIKSDGTRLFLSTKEGISEDLLNVLLSQPPERIIELHNTIIKNDLSIVRDGKRLRNLLALPLRSTTELECLLILLNKGSDFTVVDEDSLFNFAFQSFYIISLQNKLAMLATTDGLTGLYNHRTFQTRLSEELLRAERYNKSIILLLLDIDHFKRFNDTYGHQTGDDVLKTIAKIIKGNIRKVDFPARYGGEEFAVILPESNCDHAMIVAERIRTSVMDYPFYLKDGSRIQITVSIGISCFPNDATQKEDLIKKADTALYHAKNTGRNRVSLFSKV